MKTLEELREDEALLVARAEKKLAELTDDTSTDQARSIEAEHDEILKELEAVRAEIAKREAEQRNAPTLPSADLQPSADERTATDEEIATKVALAIAQDSKRRNEIIAIARQAKIEGEPLDTALNERMSADAFRKVAFEKMAAEAEARPTSNARSQVEVVRGGLEETETRRNAVINSLLNRYSATLFPLEDAAREYRGLTLVDLAREMLEDIGERTRGYSRGQIAERALHSTSDFPEILAAVTNKTLRQAYDAYPRTFPVFCRQVLATDFKSMRRIQLGEAPQLLEVNESGEFKRGTLGEAKESYRIKTYGRVVSITRQTLVNDDLDAFTRMPAMYGNSIAQLESDIVWGVITDNAAMGDGTALFHASHKNLANPASALDAGPIAEGRAKMRTQTGIDKKTVLNIRPTFLIVPAALENKADQILAQNMVPTETGKVVSQSIRSLTPIVEPRLDAASETAWYLAASPQQIDTIEYAYLEGQQGAYIETRQGFDVDGVDIKCRLDFGAKAIDWRGFYKNAGSGS
ncbi:MAG: Mu-like prophage major head subunit gpT family protein [Devosia sp.]